MTDEHAETEARLRAALSARADAVEPRPADPAAAIAAGQAAARRRRTLLAAAAVVVVLALVGGALLVLGNDDGEEDVATGPDETSTTSTTELPVGTQVSAIWPLPSMSIQYEDPIQAAEAFMSGYVGIDAECSNATDPNSDGSASFPCRPAGATCDSEESCRELTAVRMDQRGLGWVVLEADSFNFDVTSPRAGAVVGANIEVDVTGLGDNPTIAISPPPPQATAELRPLGDPPGTSPTVDDTTIPLGDDGSWHLILGAADGPTVLVVHDGLTATARVITVDSAAVPVETTTTTTGPTDDGTQGWPGNTSRHFNEPEAAAFAFVDDVLGFADSTLADVTVEGRDAEVALTSRPTATATTTVQVHNTGPTRGWVVTGTTSTSGTIDSITFMAGGAIVEGSATAFEATITMQVLNLQGDVLLEEQTQAGSNGEMGPYSTGFDEDMAIDPIIVLIAEGDASGEGRFIWGTAQVLGG